MSSHSRQNDLDRTGATDIFGARTKISRGRAQSEDVLSGNAQSIVRRMRANQTALVRNYLSALRAAENGAQITPAAEWLLDNHHIVDESFRHIRRDLTRKFIRKLPKSPEGGPHVLGLAEWYLEVSALELSFDGLKAFVSAAQSDRSLTIGELWALPALLRFALLEKLSRISESVANARRSRVAANALATKVLAASPVEAAGLVSKATDLLDTAYATQLIYRLREGNAQANAGLGELERLLEAEGTSIEATMTLEHSRQSRSNLVVGNIIRSLIKVNEINWAEWFELVSHSDAAMREAPDFANLDPQTRNTYRGRIERLAERSKMTEIELATNAVALGAEDGIGHLLVGDRQAEFERHCGYRPTMRERLFAAYRKLNWIGIFGPGFLLTLAVALLMMTVVPDTVGGGTTAMLFILALFSASEAGMSVVNLVFSVFLPVSRLPAFDYRNGVPEEARTLVVVPCLIDSLDTVDELVEQLERHYLSGPKGAVDYALLTDWPDSSNEVSVQDAEVLDHAVNQIEALAERYMGDGGRRFFLLHRNRSWNAVDRVWMGWERKRGKLSDLNRMLLTGDDAGFARDTGPRPDLATRFVVTLDADTRLTANSVARLVGKMMHPVNRPHSDPETGVVIRGHGVLQPRVSSSLTTGEEASIYQYVMSGNRGLDPYVFAASDLYQDFLDEGSYTGKGIYDVQAFENAVGNRLPENLILSHDLLEGSFARAGLASDVEIVEDFPIRYDIEAARQHRWVRGDWQLLPFILDTKNGLTSVGRLKMIDNLRRSLVPVSWTLASIIGWLVLPLMSALIWQGALLGTLYLSSLLSVQRDLLPSREASWLRHTMRLTGVVFAHFREIILRTVFIAHAAWSNIDAIGRTFWRLYVSQRKLLEWKSYAATMNGTSTVQAYWWRLMYGGPIFGVLGLVSVALINPETLPVAGVLSLLWIASPTIAHVIGRTRESVDRLNVTPPDAAYLRQIARSTWRYFEEFVTPEHNHLPPDNYQEEPEPKVAARTSPTNIGLYLVSVITARELGWISLTQALERIEATLSTIESLPRYRGHLYNWYDTRTREILPAQYVSTVDSGNLAGHLVAVASALRNWRETGAALEVPVEGVRDTAEVLAIELERVPDDRRKLRALRRRLEERIEGFRTSHDTLREQPELAAVRALNLSVVANDIQKLARALDAESASAKTADIVYWAGALQANCQSLLQRPAAGDTNLGALRDRLTDLSERARKFAFEMDFGFLLNTEKELLSVGYLVEKDELDWSSYDLLASEARLASFFAIAKGDVPARHWQRLGRPMSVLHGSGVLISWSGSMFEYLMAPLVLEERPGSILMKASMGAIREHMRYARRRGVPWGISESAFAARDRDLNYQYYAFGVPRLALKRIPKSDIVVAPYATLLASQYEPHLAVENLKRLEREGAMGRFGFYDAVDYTKERLPRGSRRNVVANYMAHHHGMSIVAIGNVVNNRMHNAFFHSDPVVQASDLLLQERSPRDVVPITRRPASRFGQGSDHDDIAAAPFVDATKDRHTSALLSNGTYAVHHFSDGSNASYFGDIAVTRWRPDATQPGGGTSFFLRDVTGGASHALTASQGDDEGQRLVSVLSDHKAEYFATLPGLETKIEAIVASERPTEARRISVRNTTQSPKVVELISYGEIVLDKSASDRAHPAFSKMFVKTEIREGGSLIMARRNARTHNQRFPALAHFVSSLPTGAVVSAETDRRSFIGRGRTLRRARALEASAGTGGRDGFTLDPIFSIRVRMTIPPMSEVRAVFWTAVEHDMEALDASVRQSRRPEAFDHEERLSWTHSQVQLHDMGISLDEAALFRRFATALTFGDSRLAVQDETLRNAVHAQSNLWPCSISGDKPIMVLRIDTDSDVPIARTAMRMMDYFRTRRIDADLVIINEREGTYLESLQTELEVARDLASRIAGVDAGRLGVYVLRQDRLDATTYETLLATARVALHARNGALSEQISRLLKENGVIATRAPAPHERHAAASVPDQGLDDLEFANGIGGFAENGREYVVRLNSGQHTPHPWINVIARDDFGFHVSAEGTGYTWAANSRDYQVTPWSNDPVVDMPGEAIHLWDPEGRRFASPFASCSNDPSARFETRHGFGYTVCHAYRDWIELEATQILHPEVPAKVTRLRVTNTDERSLSLDCWSYCELVLGQDRSKTAPVIRSTVEPGRSTILSENRFILDYGDRVSALATDRALMGHITSRSAYLGANPSVHFPEGPRRRKNPDFASREDDPCAAVCGQLTIPPGESREIFFILANGPKADIGSIVDLGRQTEAFETWLDHARSLWESRLSAIQVETPDRALDVLVNGWLPYQTWGCRLTARSAFYQASGAFGFRDQLQDSLSLLLHDPSIARAQILRAAGRQFQEGDVQHWWLPDSGSGVRTLISDDIVWLVYATATYVNATGDIGLLDEKLEYLKGPKVEEGEHDAFFTPDTSDETGTLLDHCARALDLAIERTGAHGLPLILGGDWNDGMNEVGIEGRGESVWLAWFMATAIDEFLSLPMAADHSDAARWRAHRDGVVASIETEAWDGKWYLRGFFDDGAPLGSSESDACRIDSIAQSWSAISGRGDPARSNEALSSALAELAQDNPPMMRLFRPPFTQDDRNPGYLRSYPPGVRENGGQYTHAATWLIYALAKAGRPQDALDTFHRINPISQSHDLASALRYRIEPYVVAADIYGSDDREGRGGWTWYTGASGWLMRSVVEGLLGIKMKDGELTVEPSLPEDWPGYRASVRVDGKWRTVDVVQDETGVSVNLS